MWAVLKQIAKNTTVYYRQLNLFLIIALMGVGAYFVQSQLISPQNAPQASTELPRALAPQVGNDVVDYDVVIDKAAKVTVNDSAVNGVISFERERDKFLLIITESAPDFISELTATVRLPYPVESIESLSPRIFAVHTPGTQAFYRIIDSQTIEFKASEIYETGTISLEIIFPKTYFSLTPLGRLQNRLATFSPESWLLIGIIFPGITLLFLLYMTLVRITSALRIRTKEVVSQPPGTDPPALVGSLYYGHIGKREITATLFHLAIRGYIAIHQTQEGAVSFTKGANLFNQNATQLRPFEIFLLHQIFGEEGFISRGTNVEVSLNRELFSSRVAMALLNIYDAALAEGYFIQSPNRYFLKFRAFGLISFFLALVGLLFGAFTLHARGFSLFAWVGMIVASLLIIRATPGMPRRTARGNTIARQWRAFRNYLSSSTPIEKGESDQFFSFLPYAIVLGCEDQWVKRWQKQTLILPSWYTAEKTLYTADEYGASLVSVIRYLANSLISARPPDLA